MTLVLLEVIHNLLLGVKPISTLMQQYHLTGINSDSGKVQEVYKIYSRFEPIHGKDVLEIRPGQTLEVLDTALTAGAASCTAVDVSCLSGCFRRPRYLVVNGRLEASTCASSCGLLSQPDKHEMS